MNSEDQKIDKFLFDLKSHDPIVRYNAVLYLGQYKEARGPFNKNEEIFISKILMPFTEVLSDEDASIRELVIKYFRYSAANAIPALKKALLDEIDAVREEAAYSLGSLEAHDAVDCLIARLEVEINNDVKSAIVSALGNIPDERVVTPLVNALKSDDANTRHYAAMALAETRNALVVDPLCHALEDEDDDVRGSAAHSLWSLAAFAKIKDPKSIPFICKALNDPSKHVRGKAAQALGEIKLEETLPFLEKALNDPDSGIKEEVIEAIAKISINDNHHHILCALRDEDVNIQRAAARSLTTDLLDDRLVPDLIFILLDLEIDYHTRSAIAEALELSDNPSIIPALIKALADENVYVRESAANTLISKADALAYEPLLKALKDPEARVRGAAVQALAAIGDEAAIEPISHLLDDEDYIVRKETLWALNFYNSSEILPFLLKGIKDEHPYAREIAVKCLEEYNGDDILSHLLEALQDTHDEVRRSAVVSLTRNLEYNNSRRERKIIFSSLSSMVDKEGPYVLSAIATALGHFKDRKTQKILFKLTEHTDDGIRLAAFKALLNFNDTKIRKFIVDGMINDTCSHVRRQLIYRLSDIQEEWAYIALKEAVKIEKDINNRKEIQDLLEYMVINKRISEDQGNDTKNNNNSKKSWLRFGRTNYE